MTINVSLIPILSDNYAYLLEAENGDTAIVDPGEAEPIIDVLDNKNLSPHYILNTHHHGDHIAGNADLKSRYGAKIVGPASEVSRIPDMDIALREGEIFTFSGEDFQILETPGHTRGHICFYAPQSKILFAGDTLFAMGCGRFFEGTPADMFGGFQKILALPDETKIYCGHEYTLANAKFCAHADPDNAEIQTRLKDVQAMRDAGKPTLPTTLDLEKKTNVFLRAGSAKDLGELRAQKDSF